MATNNPFLNYAFQKENKKTKDKETEAVVEDIPIINTESTEQSTDTEVEVPENTPNDIFHRIKQHRLSNYNARIDAELKGQDESSSGQRTESINAIIENPNYKGSEDFEALMDKYFEENPEDAKYRNFLTNTAKIESSFANVQNHYGAPAYGFFQLYKGNWGDNTGEDLLKDPNKQISLAIQLHKNNMSTFTDKDWEEAKKQGFTKNAMLSGAWLGGVGGVRDVLYKGISASDKHHSKDGKTGDDVRSRMIANNYKEGGSIKEGSYIVNIGNKDFTLTISETEQDKSKGLSEKSSLKDNEGMLFVIDEDDKDTEGLIWFTMEDTSIPLDIIFIDDNYEVTQVSKGEPYSKTPIYGQGNFVLEVSADSGIQVGDVLEFTTSETVNTKMLVLDSEGNTQMSLDGGERIFSIHNTKILIRFAKKCGSTNKDNDYKALGKRVFKFLQIQDSNEPEYVE